MSKLSDRIESYKNQSDYKLLNKLPLILVINGKSFNRATSLLDKPFCNKFAECMNSTMMKLCSIVEGAIFAYQFSDEIVIFARNDQSIDTSPWFDNKIQKITSTCSSIASLHFAKCSNAVELNLLGDDQVFITNCFSVPNISEVINTFIYKQQQNFHIAIHNACVYELLNKKYEKDSIKEMLSGLSIDEKIGLLSQECNIDFNSYSLQFRRGSACYKVPKIVDQAVKSKWIVNDKIPIFTKDQAFISNILKNGYDIFRSDSI